MSTLLLSACSTQPPSSAQQSIPENAIIAHRGDSYNAPEATMAAY